MTQISPIVAFPEVLGGVLRHRRRESGQDQASVAAAVGLSTSSWSRIENGQAPLTVAQFRAAAGAMGLPAWQLLKMVEDVCDKIPQSSPVSEILPDRPTDAQVAAGWFLGGAAVGALVSKLLSKQGRRRGSGE